MLRSILVVLGSTLATAVHTSLARARAQARAEAVREHLGTDDASQCGEGVTTTPVLVYANMDRGNQLFSLRGSAEQEQELDAEDSESFESESEGSPAAAGNKTAVERPTPLCMAIYKALRTFEKGNELNECLRQNKKATEEAGVFLQRFDEDGAQEFLQPHYAKCLHTKVNQETAQLATSGNCLSGLTKDFVEFQMKNKGKGVSMQCKAEACLKFNSRKDKKFQKCQEKYEEELEKVEDLKGSSTVYSKLLKECAGVSELCSRQNGWPMAWKANVQMLKSIGINGIR